LSKHVSMKRGPRVPESDFIFPPPLSSAAKPA